ncbi:MAG: hypothetical protein Q9M36_01305 [Sulfurovum sp.]|nr:hypothetical protein [Sulfurovum sp.]
MKRSDTLLENISTRGYSEAEIEETLIVVKKLVAIEEAEEASELLYICASLIHNLHSSCLQENSIRAY